MASHRATAVSSAMWPALLFAAVAALALLPPASTEDTACSPGGEVCVSPTRDELVFLDEEFRRLCHYVTSDPSDSGADLEWFRDGQPIGPALRNINQLIIDHIDSSDAGNYSCRGTLVADGTVIGPVSAGIITVFEIIVPPDPYILTGTNYNLTCQSSLADPHQVFWTNVSGNFVYPNSPVLSIVNADISTEGEYICEVVHGSGRAETNTVTVHIVVPHEIISKPPPYQLIEGNPQKAFTVEFQGREEQNSTVTWFRDNEALTLNSPKRRIETTFQSGQLRGTTSLIFDEISRADAGVYRMMLDSNLDAGIFPDDQRMAETSFQFAVMVPPSLPANLAATEVNFTATRVTWALTNPTADAGADTLTLTVRYSETIDEYLLAGNETALLIAVIPGTEYEFALTARNQDGSATTQPALYQTPPGAPSISDIYIVRMNETSFHLSVGVHYTGGGDITQFDVSFRHSDSGTGFDRLGLIPATVSPDSVLEWNSIITIPELQEIDGQLHFRVSALNSHGLRHTTEAPENLVLPGAPQPSLDSSTTTSLTISIQLSQEGSAPILQLTAILTNSELQFSRTYNLSGPFNPGQVVTFIAEDLISEEPFVVVTYATNVAGIGPNSQAVTFAPVLEMESALPIPLWALVAIGGGAVVLVLFLITCALTCYRCHRRPRKRNYNVNKRPQKPQKPIARISSPLSADMHRLDSSNPLVTRPDKTISLINGGFPLTTFTAPKSQVNKHHTDGPDNLVQRNTSTTSFEDSPPTTKSRLERGSSTILPQRTNQAVSSTTLGSTTPVSVKREPDNEGSENGNEHENEDSGVEVERSNLALPQSASAVSVPRSATMPRGGANPDPQFQRELSHRVQSRSSSALPQETSVPQRSASMAIPGPTSDLPYKASSRQFGDSAHRMKSESAHALSLTDDLYRTSSASATHPRGAPLPHFNQRFRNETVSTSSCNASASEVTDSSMDLEYPQYMPSLHDYHGESIHSLPTLRSGMASVHSTQESSIQYPVHVYPSQYVSDV